MALAYANYINSLNRTVIKAENLQKILKSKKCILNCLKPTFVSLDKSMKVFSAYQDVLSTERVLDFNLTNSFAIVSPKRCERILRIVQPV